VPVLKTIQQLKISGRRFADLKFQKDYRRRKHEYQKVGLPSNVKGRIPPPETPEKFIGPTEI
jgi:hypothetical protein